MLSAVGSLIFRLPHWLSHLQEAILDSLRVKEGRKSQEGTMVRDPSPVHLCIVQVTTASAVVRSGFLGTCSSMSGVLSSAPQHLLGCSV